MTGQNRAGKSAGTSAGEANPSVWTKCKAIGGVLRPCEGSDRSDGQPLRRDAQSVTTQRSDQLVVSVSDAVEASELHVEVEEECKLVGWKRETVVVVARGATPRSRGGLAPGATRSVFPVDAGGLMRPSGSAGRERCG